MTGENRPSPRLCPKKGPLPSRSPAAWGRALSKENLLPPQPLRGLPWLLRENQDGSEQPQCGPLSDPVCRAHPGAGSVQRDRWEWWSGRLGAPAVLTQVTEELERSESAWRPALLLPGAGDVGLGRWDPLKKGLYHSCLGQPQSICPNLGLVPTRSPPAAPALGGAPSLSPTTPPVAQLVPRSWPSSGGPTFSVHLWRGCRRGTKALGGC